MILLAVGQIEQIYDSCVAQLRDFVHGAGFDHVVIGLSGGIDSSLVAVMAVDAFGADCVHGILMPGPFSSSSSVEDAQELAVNLGISTHTFSINQAFEALSHCFTVSCGKPFNKLASENTQSRCRTVALMAFSNTFGWLMLNTGNRSEAAMGYSTLYGDTAGAFAPIGGLFKTQVYAVANWVNAHAKEKGCVAPIPQNVINKPPSAELSACQTDEAALGIDYETLDKILIEYLDCGRSVDEIVVEGVQADQIEQVAKRYIAAEFKRAAEPPFAKI